MNNDQSLIKACPSGALFTQVCQSRARSSRPDQITCNLGSSSLPTPGKGLVTNNGKGGGVQNGRGGACEVLPLQKKGGGGGDLAMLRGGGHNKFGGSLHGSLKFYPY